MRRVPFALLALALGMATSSRAAEPVKLLIITGDQGHDWKATTKALQDGLSAGGRFKIDVTTTPAKDLTHDNLDKYDVLLLNYKDTGKPPADTTWSDENKKAFLHAVHDDGKGLVVYHYASAAFTKPNWAEFEKAIAGGWRTQGFHGPSHVFKVKTTGFKHPVSEGMPAEAEHAKDELYQNSMLTPGSVVLATAYSDPAKPKGTGKDEAVVWVNNYGKGRVFECALGHDAAALDKTALDWLRRGSEWAATGKVESSAAAAKSDAPPAGSRKGRRRRATDE
jgi:type 1 glutamine amidotransferase